MTAGLAVSTVVGGFLFPFLIRMYWGKLVDDFGPIGGWLAAGFLVGLVFTINHSLTAFAPDSVPLIHQTGAWVDMAWAAGVGLLTATTILGGSFSKAVPNILAAIVGGTLAGFILSLIL